MFPYCSVIFFIATIIGLGISTRLIFVWKSEKDENIGYFFKAMAIATVYFLLSALPGTVVKNPSIAALFYVVAWIPLYLTLFYFTRLALNFWGLKKFKNVFSVIIFSLIIFITFFNFVYFSPTEIKAYKNFSFCFERSPSWILNFSGIVTSLLLLLNSILFFRGGILSQEKVTRIRGLSIGIGLLFIATSIFFKYVIAPYWQETQIFIFYSGPLFLLGITGVYLGIQYKKRT